MSLGLGDDAFARIDEDDGQFGGGRAGDHVARVLNVAGRVGDDELAARRGEVAVGHVDGDALLAFGAQAVGEQREVNVGVAALSAGALYGFQLILEDGFAVQQHAADQRALAVVDAAGGGEAQQVHGHVAVQVGGLLGVPKPALLLFFSKS